MAAPHYKTILAQQQEYLPDSRVLLDYSSMSAKPLDPISNPASDYFSRVLRKNPLPSIGYSGLSSQKMNDTYTFMKDYNLLEKNLMKKVDF